MKIKTTVRGGLLAVGPGGYGGRGCSGGGGYPIIRPPYLLA
ncbi:hypothetical protein [Archangium violaceum]|nr:hypothetical protein [Archangium violaceum]